MARKAITVSQLNAYIARLLSSDGALSDIVVTGEVSGFKLHQSGHVFFSLKDAQSRVNCFLPGNVYRAMDAGRIAEGMKITAEGYVNVYEKGGSYSLTIRRLTSEGQGDLDAKYEALKEKLKQKGYFDPGRKRPIPSFALRVGIVTSNTGAAVEDMVKIITQRNAVADVLIFPTLVQGEGAAEMIASRIREAGEQLPAIDVLIVGRGGGSKEDLWAFNEEAVADAIYTSKTPVVSAVGHESDITIADFVADLRAETPTAAAQMAVPDTFELTEDIDALLFGLRDGARRTLRRDELRVRAYSPEAEISAFKSGLGERRARAERAYGEMENAIGRQSVHERALRADALSTGMRHTLLVRMERASDRAEGQAERLEALSPFGVLSRGYAIVEKTDGKAVSSASGLETGDEAKVIFRDGRVSVMVKEVTSNGENR
ncbi:MAG: exodeoxyribonuclease VII large subunit [Clostridiales Family XIII bacterium]|jgi:exodeoxyribonuclease VII large subunit|nr:exodeoxyribonuclease VII large subunit [Clostridiales Family XIII bacterium]